MLSDEAVDNVVAALSEIFDKAFVMSAAVRRTVVRTMLERSELFDVTDSKFDLQRLMDMVRGSQDPVDTKTVINVNVGLSPADRAMVTACYPEVTLKFADSTRVPHGLAYVSRIVETSTLLARVPPGISTIGDLGGNYMAYKGRPYRFQIHCCTKLEGASEHHRQSQRQAAIERGEQYVDYCTGGTEECAVPFEHAISVNALPLIDPGKIVSIFRRHNMRDLDATFHYEAMMHTGVKRGFIAEVGQHWVVKGNDVLFYFENDSSEPYPQRLDWTLHYAQPWMQSEPDWEYVLRHEVREVTAGSARTFTVRLEKATVGYVRPAPPLRWLGGEGKMVVPVPKYDSTLGLTVHDPRAYRNVYYSVPLDLYNFVMMKGLSNESSRPDQPLSRDTVADGVRVYNVSRSVGGVPLTEKLALSAVEADDIATGLYLAVVAMSAYKRATLSTHTEQMLRVQRRWGTEGTMWMAARCVSWGAVMPLVYLANGFGEVVDVFTVLLERFQRGGGLLELPQPWKPWIKLPKVTYSPEEGIGVFAVRNIFPGEQDGIDEDSRELSAEEVETNMKEFYHNFRSILPDELKANMESSLFDGKPPDVSVPPAPSLAGIKAPERQPGCFIEDDDASEEDLPTREEANRYIVENRNEWETLFDKVQRGAPDWAFNDKIRPEEGSPDDVKKYAELRVLEYALYCFDLHQGTTAKVLEWLSAHWGVEAPNLRVLKQDNDAKEIGAAFYPVVDGFVQNIPEGVMYDVLVDPVDKRFIQVQRKANGQYVGKTRLDVVYGLEMLRIYNSKRAGVAAMKILDEGLRVDTGVNFELIDGIAGSGKTRALMQGFTLQDTYATGPRASAEKQLVYLSENRFPEARFELSKRVRTVDSCVLNKVRVSKNLYVDEGLMTHSGVFWLLAHKTQARRVRVSGDGEQIPMIDRGSGRGKLVFAQMRYWNAVQYLNVSVRMPCDVTCSIRGLYPEWRQPLIKTSSPVRRSLRAEVVPNTNDPRYWSPMPYEYAIVHLQGDKQQLLARTQYIEGKQANQTGHPWTDPRRPVLSTHEAQGETVPVSRMMRLNKFSGQIYESDPHNYVIRSRHELLGVYITPVSDKLYRLIKTAESYPEEMLEAVQVEPEEGQLERLTDLKRKVEDAGHQLRW